MKEQNLSKYITSLVLGVAVFSTAAVAPAFAQVTYPTAGTTTAGAPTTVAGSPAPGNAMRLQRQENRTTLRKDNADKEIDRRVARLQVVIAKINGMVRVSAQQKADLVAQAQSQISALTALKAKIDADTDPATLMADKKSIVDSYRIFALFIPKVEIIAHADAILQTATNMTNYNAQLTAAISKAQAAGKDVTAMQSAMTDRTAKIADANTQAQNAITAVTPLTPEGYPGNKTTLQTGLADLKAARTDLQQAHKDGLTIVAGAKGAGVAAQ